MGRGNVSVSGPYEGVFFVDRDNTDLFVISVEDNEWSYAVLLLQKQDEYDNHLLGLQKRHHQKYLTAIKEAILDMYGEVGIYTGPWTSGIERRTDRAS